MDKPKDIHEIRPDLHWVGVKDWERRMFDRLIPTPSGTSYNSYLLQGDEKTMLIDTVNPGYEKELEEKLRQVIDPTEIDYIVMNHAEPDHANAIAHTLSVADGASVLATSKGKELINSLHHVDGERVEIVEQGDTIDLGGKTLQFLDTPWLHWPETMMTYYPEEEILFSCDFFGTHLATSKFYDEEIGDTLISQAKRYYGEIMMPFRKMVSRALDKIEKLDIELIAPSHGPMYKNPDRIIKSYRDWAEGNVEEKVLLIYISMWGSTKEMADTLTGTISSENVEIVPINLAQENLGKIAEELVDSKGIIIGTPTVLGGSHPKIHHVVHLAKKLNPPTKYLGVIESHGWSGGAVSEIAKMVDSLDAEIVDTVEILGSPREEDIQEVINFGKKFSEKIKK